MMTLAEFLAWEETQPGRHEFVRGEVFAMVGARRVHGIVSGNVFATLRQQLRGTPCQAFTESMKLKVADDVLFYPDVFVDPDTREVQLFRRGADGLFTLHDLTGMPQVDLVSIGCSLPADEIFERLDAPVQGTPPGV